MIHSYFTLTCALTPHIYLLLKVVSASTFLVVVFRCLVVGDYKNSIFQDYFLVYLLIRFSSFLLLVAIGNMVMCFVPDCKHYSERRTCKFLRFPKDAALAKQWVRLIRRGDVSPTLYSLVCSCHFVNGDRNNLPTLFDRNEKKRFEFHSPEKKENTVKSPAVSGIPKHRISPAINECVGENLPSSSNSRFEHLETLTLNNGSAQQESEMYFLQKQNEELAMKLKQLSMAFSFQHIQHDDKLINMYTGIPNRYLFDTLYDLFKDIEISYYKGWNVTNIPKKEQLLITLMKLRLNLKHADLACRFNSSSTTISNVVSTWILALHEILFCQLMNNIPSRQKNKLCMPACFSTFTNCRIVLDCTEVTCEKPSSLLKQKTTYSSYKHRNTLKGLVGVAPNGVITFISDLYPGSVSDKRIVENSGILNKMEPGDLILADKGFLIKDILPADVSLNIPPFLTTTQFTPQQVIQTRTIARARIHVERAIRRIKCYTILHCIPQNLLPQANALFQVCGALTNMQFPLIAEVEDLYKEM